MLGEFSEFAVAARPLAASFEFYRAIGFSSLPVSDTLPDPYVVLSDGDIAVGLHEHDREGAWLTFVRPGLRDYVRALRRIGVQLDHVHLADNEFHRVGFRDPGGQGVTLLEARTFAPAERSPSTVTACGTFLEYSVPAASLSSSMRFWEPLGFAIIANGEAPHPWAQLRGHGLTIGLHEAYFRPGLSYRAPRLQARLDFLRAKGITAQPGSALADREQASATLVAPEGLTLYLLEGGKQ